MVLTVSVTSCPALQSFVVARSDFNRNWGRGRAPGADSELAELGHREERAAAKEVAKDVDMSAERTAENPDEEHPREEEEQETAKEAAEDADMSAEAAAGNAAEEHSRGEDEEEAVKGAAEDADMSVDTAAENPAEEQPPQEEKEEAEKEATEDADMSAETTAENPDEEHPREEEEQETAMEAAEDADMSAEAAAANPAEEHQHEEEELEAAKEATEDADVPGKTAAESSEEEQAEEEEDRAGGDTSAQVDVEEEEEGAAEPAGIGEEVGEDAEADAAQPSSPKPEDAGPAGCEGNMEDSMAFTPKEIQSNLCKARIWNSGHGGQCSMVAPKDGDFCGRHRSGWKVHGRVDGPIPEAKLKEFQRFQKRLAKAKGSEKGAKAGKDGRDSNGSKKTPKKEAAASAGERCKTPSKGSSRTSTTKSTKKSRVSTSHPGPLGLPQMWVMNLPAPKSRGRDWRFCLMRKPLLKRMQRRGPPEIWRESGRPHPRQTKWMPGPAKLPERPKRQKLRNPKRPKNLKEKLTKLGNALVESHSTPKNANSSGPASSTAAASQEPPPGLDLWPLLRSAVRRCHRHLCSCLVLPVSRWSRLVLRLNSFPKIRGEAPGRIRCECTTQTRSRSFPTCLKSKWMRRAVKTHTYQIISAIIWIYLDVFLCFDFPQEHPFTIRFHPGIARISSARFLWRLSAAMISRHASSKRT